MRRLLTLLILFAMVSVHGPVLATLMCEHHDTLAHAAALKSAESGVSAAALDEERAVQGSSASALLGHAAATVLGGYILPPEPKAPARDARVRATVRVTHDARPSGRSVLPLLEPPLA